MAAFVEFYKHGFQGGSLNHIVETAGTTKGALFHHFESKQELGYAVLDEVIGPLLQQRWLSPEAASQDAHTALTQAFRQYITTDIDSGSFNQGCPLNNMAQEMSPLDKGFRQRIDKLYDTWRTSYAAAFADGIKTHKVRKDISPRNVAALVVASQMGIWGTAKSSQDPQLMVHACEALCDYLDGLKP
jgi:TetR/AcrR family transcriptional repressor of nem operon